MSVNSIEQDLKRLHDVELAILSEFDRICANNNILYFLDSGTALGAVRHQGFIPWDDDIDVGMLRDDYEKFLEIAPVCLSDSFYLHSLSTDINYNKLHAKLRMKGTFFPEPGTENFKCRGVYIDIFPFDYVSDNRFISRFEIRFGKYLRHWWAIRKYGSNKNRYKKFLSVLLKAFPTSFYERAFNRFVRIHNNKTCHLTCYYYKMRLKRSFKKEWFIPTKSVVFENRSFMIMNNTDAYLSTMYGDYMTLPPVSGRVYHFDGEIII